MPPKKPCKDCLAESAASGDPIKNRPAPNPGPRCATHWRAEKKRRGAASHAKKTQKTYGLGPGDYERLRALQGGRCAICRRATGASRRLSVDHDHRCCSGPTSCGRCVRGLLCRPCNSYLGHARDDVHFLVRAIRYLLDPPAKHLEQP